MIGKTNINLMPPNIGGESLTNGFSSSFVDKILTIFNTLDNLETIDKNLGSKCTNDFKHFDSLSDENVVGVIKKTQNILPVQLTQSDQN